MRSAVTAIIEREDDGFVALCPELNIATQGSSIEEARTNLIEALTLFYEVADDFEISRRMKGRHTIAAVKVRDLLRLVEADGWEHVRTTGSHRHYKHPLKPNVVTIPGHPGDDVPTGTLKSVLKAARLEKKQ